MEINADKYHNYENKKEKYIGGKFNVFELLSVQ